MKTQMGLLFFCCGFQLVLKAMEDAWGVFQCFVSDLIIVFYNHIFRDEFTKQLCHFCMTFFVQKSASYSLATTGGWVTPVVPGPLESI